MADTPRLTVRCEYPDTDLPPTEVTFRLSPSYGIHNAREAHDWFLLMMRSHDEFVVETDKAGESPLPFWSETEGVAWERAPSQDRTCARRVVLTNEWYLHSPWYCRTGIGTVGA